MNNCKCKNPGYGEVKWYDRNKEYGFLLIDGVDEDVFFHRTDTKCKFYELKEGVPVHCCLKAGPEGPFALNVTLGEAS